MIRSGFCYSLGLDDLRSKLLRLKQTGNFDGVELWHNVVWDVDKPRLKEYLDEAELACAQICPYFEFTEGEAAYRHSLELGRQYLSFSRQLGGPLIRVFTGHVAGPEATPEQWQAAMTGLQILCDEAAEDGLRFCLEIGHGLMSSSAEVLRLLEGVDRPNLGVNLQICLPGEAPEYTLEQLGPYTIHMHAHNWVGRIGGTDITWLNSGLLDYEDFLSKLLAYGFDGYVSVEHVDHVGKHDPWVTASVDGRYLEQLKRKLNPGG